VQEGEITLTIKEEGGKTTPHTLKVGDSYHIPRHRAPQAEHDGQVLHPPSLAPKLKEEGERTKPTARPAPLYKRPAELGTEENPHRFVEISRLI
jgi:hypothetical protein